MGGAGAPGRVVIQKHKHTHKRRSQANKMSDTTQMVVQAIQDRISRLKKGFEIESRELDGCDEYGEKHWVECRNGFSGRSWDIEPTMKDDIKYFFKRIKEKGIKVKGNTYYLDPEVPLQESNLDVVLIDKSKFMELSKNMRIVKLMLKKYFDFLEDECKEKFKDASLDVRCYRFNLLGEFKQKLSWTSCVSRESFIRGIHEHLTATEFQKVKRDYKKNMVWNEEEIRAFNL